MGVPEARIFPLRTGTNPIYAETGPDPRDTVEVTTKGIGFSVEACRNLIREAGYTPLDGPTAVFRGGWV